MARNTRARRNQRIQFIILSVFVVMSMSVSLLAVLNPVSVQPTPPATIPVVITLPPVQITPTPSPTPVLTRIP